MVQEERRNQFIVASGAKNMDEFIRVSGATVWSPGKVKREYTKKRVNDLLAKAECQERHPLSVEAGSIPRGV